MMQRIYELKKETTRMRRFWEHAGDEPIEMTGDIYISKAALATMGNPAKIKVTVEPVEDGNA